MTDKLRVLDLFSGLGGFSLGLERTNGFETVAFCEIEDFPRKVLAKHWPDVPCYRDVRELTAAKLAADGIAVDVICGGFPCQDISFAGKGAGLAGERSGLFYEVARLIGELGPDFVILENVGALLSRGLDAVLGTLASLGYDAEWHCIPASYVGAPHRRDRVWIVAHANSIGRLGCEFGPQGHIGAAQLGTGHSGQALANSPQLQRDGSELHGEHSQGEVSELGTGGGAGDVADADGAGLEGRSEGGNAGEVGPWVQQFIERRVDRNRAIWRSEPDVGRVANGVPDRAHRLKSLGNAVVPQIPELIGHAILASRKPHDPHP